MTHFVFEVRYYYSYNVLDPSETALLFEILQLPKKEKRFYEICTRDKHRVHNNIVPATWYQVCVTTQNSSTDRI